MDWKMPLLRIQIDFGEGDKQMTKRSSAYLAGRVCCKCKCGNEGTYRNNSGSYFWYGCKCGNENLPDGYVIRITQDFRVENILI